MRRPIAVPALTKPVTLFTLAWSKLSKTTYEVGIHMEPEPSPPTNPEVKISRVNEFEIDEKTGPALIKPPPSRMVLPGPFVFMKRARRMEEKENSTAKTPKTMDVAEAGRLYSLDTRVKKTP